ncbi:EAL domain-containing protein [Lysinibacillus sp. 3P01SB]|uniref:sensor domain-containing protein n=1 Tax=Lysinibacillus sp. 3P01SB TaxID=3132284 RepID=UPI0039A4C64E
MTVYSLRYETDTLFYMLKDLGDKSGRKYLILDDSLSILYSNNLYTELTGFELQDIYRFPFRSLLQQKMLHHEIKEIEERLHKGKITKAELMHDRKSGIPFYAGLECLPFQGEQNHTKLVLVFVKDVTYIQLQNFVDRLEKEMFQAIQHEISFIEKIQLICNGIDHLFHPGCFTTFILQHHDKFQMIQSDLFHQGKRIQYPLEQSPELKCYEKMMHIRQVAVYEDFNHLYLHQPHKDLALENGFTRCIFLPVRKEEEKLGVMVIYFGQEVYESSVFAYFFEKIIDLIMLAYSYEKKQQQIYALAYMDLSTGMVNRHGFIGRLKELKELDGVIYLLEPTEFSRIVELYGRDSGEALLKQMYERILEKCEGKHILVGRFVSSSIILYMEKDEAGIKQMTDFLKMLVEEPFLIEGRNIYITLKSGGSSIRTGESLKDSIRHAESALSEAKTYSGTMARFYYQENDAQLEKELLILNHLTEAIKNKEITAFFQPKVELRRGRITSMEALARWTSPILGHVSPAEFIPVAERAGLIREIDLQIIEQVLKWFQQRQYEGKRIVPVAINISPEHFYYPRFVEELEQLIKKYYADPNYLIIEITESLGLVDIKRAQEIIEKLFVRGLKTSVDDFGMGYSSLSYLQKLPFSELKIDRSFTSRIHEAGTLAIVRSIIQIAYNLEIDVVAEGVETKEQADVLYELGCNCVQGYLFYQPMSFRELEERNI